MVGAVRFELTTSCTRNKYLGGLLVAHSCIIVRCHALAYTRDALCLQALYGILVQIVEEEDVSGCVRKPGCVRLCLARKQGEFCVSLCQRKPGARLAARRACHNG